MQHCSRLVEFSRRLATRLSAPGGPVTASVNGVFKQAPSAPLFCSVGQHIRPDATDKQRVSAASHSSLLVGQTGSIAQLPLLPCTGPGLVRGIRSREVKKYYTEEGERNPAMQDIIDRFKRLDWGAYIHTRSGRKKHLYRKRQFIRDRATEHILTNRATSFLLDNLLNDKWRRPQHIPNDIYEPYHTRTGVPWDYKLRKRKFFP